MILILFRHRKLKEFYNSDLTVYYEKHRDELSNEDYPYAVSILNIKNEMTNDEMYEDYKILKNELNDIYEIFPEHLTVKDQFNGYKKIRSR